MTKILFLTHVLPYPLSSGAKIRAYYVLRRLSQQHAVTLVSFVRDDDTPEAITHLESFCEAVHTVPMLRSRLRDARALVAAGLTRRPVIIVRDEIAGMRALLRRLIQAEHFAVIHADQTSMAQYALYARHVHARTFTRAHVHTVLDAHNALYRIPLRMAEHTRNPLMRWFLQREARALRHYETGLGERFDHIVFVAQEDRHALQQPGGNPAPGSTPHNTSLIPICPDPQEKAPVARVPDPRLILHLGTMFWPPNVEGVLWFAREVFPQVLAEVPETQFVIVGKNPPSEVQALPLHVRNVLVTGYVPDPIPYLAKAAVFIVPLHAGGGMRVKIVDAWCWGVPIVSTTVGAEGIEVENGENILIADAPEALAQAVVRLLRDPALGERLRENGRRWVEERYNWRTAYAAWDKVYEQLINAETI